MNRLADRNKEIQLPCTGNGVFWARVHEKLARYEDTELNPEECAKYAQAEKEGRLLVLPCKVGEKVYDIISGKIQEKYYNFHSYRDEDFGRVVFLTREDAEKVLKQEVSE